MFRMCVVQKTADVYFNRLTVELKMHELFSARKLFFEYWQNNLSSRFLSAFL